MRLIKSYCFKIGTKIPFSQWSEIVHRFLSENQLNSHRFLYYFMDILSYTETKDDALPKSSCARILKDCPSLGEIRYYNGKSHHSADILYLSNIDKQDSFAESHLLPLMKKIHRTYGFSESKLYYFDVNFFGNRTHFERDHSKAMEDQPYGSGIVLHRDACADNYMELSVDLLHNGTVMDATPYYDSMQKLLPKIKATTSLKIYLTEDEQRIVDENNQAAKPVLQECCDFLDKNLPFTSSRNLFLSNYSVAKPLKKLAKQYGYTYKLLWNGGVYSLEKRTLRGNFLYLDFQTGPSRYDLGVGISYQGLGFKHNIGLSNQTPTNQQEADLYLEKVLSVASEFEAKLLPALDSLFPETPNWFMPSELP